MAFHRALSPQERRESQLHRACPRYSSTPADGVETPNSPCVVPLCWFLASCPRWLSGGHCVLGSIFFP
ncbi:hypothetical protein ACRRTK_022260 [Alexandromys fortis]